MAGKSKKNKQSNLDRIKREMTAKKQRAKTRKNAGTAVANTEKIDLPAESQLNDPVPLCDKRIEADEDIIDEGMGESITGLEYEEGRQAEKASITEIRKVELVIFCMDEEEFALRVSDIREIIRIPSISKVPNAPYYITGFCSLRGALLPVIDGRKLFGMPDREFSESSRIIVADINGKQMGLVTDRVLEVAEADEDEIKEPPAGINGIDGGVISGILILDNGKRAVMILDADKLIKECDLGASSIQQLKSAGSLTGAETKLDEEEQIVIFNIGTGEYAFSIDYVSEIIRLPDITKVPDAASYIEGVFSIRNQLTACINPAKLLGLDCGQPNENSRVIIVNSGSFSYGSVVDKVSHVAQVEKKLFKESGSNETCFGTDFINGIFRLNNGERLVMMLDPSRLIRPDDMNAIMDDVDRITADDRSYTGAADTDLKCVIFKVCQQEYGIDIMNVQEINRIDKITSFPGAPAFISGMVDLRGDIIPLLDLRRLFGIDEAEPHRTDRFLVAEFRNKKTGILIDSVSEIRSFSNAQLENAQASLRGDDQESYIDKVAKLDDCGRVVPILNLSVMLSFM